MDEMETVGRDGGDAYEGFPLLKATRDAILVQGNPSTGGFLLKQERTG